MRLPGDLLYFFDENAIDPHIEVIISVTEQRRSSELVHVIWVMPKSGSREFNVGMTFTRMTARPPRRRTKL